MRNNAGRGGEAQAWESSEVTREFTVAYDGSVWERVPCYRESTLRTAASQTRVKVLTMVRDRTFSARAVRKRFLEGRKPGD